ncbi:MAG: tyrosine--tRNA ligase [Candidatus Woesearchaeota archaeon]
MDTNEKIKLIKEVGEEIVTEDELIELIENSQKDKKEIIAYDGFEPSGKIHIAQAILRAINVNKITQSGIKFKMLVADWHAWANNKMNGDLEKIKIVGEYFIEVWKASGMDLDNVEFVWASDLVKDDNYWKIVMEVSRNATVKRVIRCCQIMGRNENEALQASQILYPCMQAADIFYLNADICQLGLDQRKVNMLAREIAPKLGYKKPISISHHMLMGLKEPPKKESSAVEKVIEMKMSKSIPDSAIFMDDNEEDISRKLRKAFCPEGIIEENPVIEYFKYIIFERFDKVIIERPEKYGGNIELNSYDELVKQFENKEIHPGDLKQCASKYINLLIEPVRKHFEENTKAKELLEKVNQFKITR